MTRILSLLFLALVLSAVAFSQGRRPSPFGPQATETAQEQAPPQSASDASALRSPSARAADPFADELTRALRAEAGWLTLHQALSEDLDNLPPCEDQSARRIAEARDAAFETFAQRTVYLQKHEQHATEFLKKVQEGQTSLAEARGELEASSRQIAQELASARRRRAALVSSLPAPDGAEETQPLHILDQLISKLEQELRLTQDTLREYDASREHLRAMVRWARERQRAARDQLDLVKAESRLWKAFYDGLAFRLQLLCAKTQPELHQFTTRSPREVGP
jgi:chromosome segregation ATPase